MVYPWVEPFNIGVSVGVPWSTAPTSQILHVGLLNPDYWGFSQCNPSWVLQIFSLGAPPYSSSLLPADFGNICIGPSWHVRIWPSHRKFCHKTLFLTLGSCNIG